MSIEVRDVHKVYDSSGYNTVALDGVTFSIGKGEFVCIMGPSGSGKSTLLNLIGALDRPTKGEVKIDSVDISELSDDALAELRNTRISFVYQSFNLIHRMNALENVAMPLLISKLPESEIRNRARKSLEALGLGKRLRHTPDRMSGGEQQRVAVARALVSRPKIILGDEPTGNLDTKTAENMVKMLKELKAKIGTTLVIVTHSSDVSKHAERIIHVRDGKVDKIVTN